MLLGCPTNLLKRDKATKGILLQTHEKYTKKKIRIENTIKNKT